jgi:hypothetical protein
LNVIACKSQYLSLFFLTFLEFLSKRELCNLWKQSDSSWITSQ